MFIYEQFSAILTNLSGIIIAAVFSWGERGVLICHRQKGAPLTNYSQVQGILFTNNG